VSRKGLDARSCENRHKLARYDFLFIADCGVDCVPDWVCVDELEEAPRCDEEDVWCDEEEEVIEPPISLATAELGSSESAHHPSGRRHR
jgi:hypothetical protein